MTEQDCHVRNQSHKKSVEGTHDMTGKRLLCQFFAPKYLYTMTGDRQEMHDDKTI